MRVSKPTVQDLRRINRSTVLRLIYAERSMSRQELSHLSGLSSGTVTNVVAELLHEGIVIESGLETSQGGRPRSILTVNSDYGYFIGVEVGETFTRVELFDLTLRKLAAAAYSLAPDTYQAPQVVHYIVMGVNTVLAESGIPVEKVIGVGIGVGGVVEYAETVSAYIAAWGWQNVPLVSLLEEHLHMPIYLDNAAKAMAQAEKLFGVGQGVEHLAVLLIGTGIGAGIITHGSLYRGANNSAGEWGHTLLELDGRLCRCGRHGCLEAYVGAPGIIERFKEAAPQSPLLQSNDEEHILSCMVDAARHGDATATQVLKDTARYLGAGIANLINLFNPQRVVMGGWAGLMLGMYILPDLRQFVERDALKSPFLAAKIELCQLGQNAAAMGAASLVLEQFLTDAGRQIPSKPQVKLLA